MMKIVCCSLVKFWSRPDCSITNATGKRHRARITEYPRLAEPARSIIGGGLEMPGIPREHVSSG